MLLNSVKVNTNYRVIESPYNCSNFKLSKLVEPSIDIMLDESVTNSPKTFGVMEIYYMHFIFLTLKN